MNGVLCLLIVYAAIGSVSYALVNNGHWITGTALMLLLLVSTKIKGDE